MGLRRLVAVLLVLVTAGCGMSLPSGEQEWAQTSVQAVDDMVGSVATARLVLDQQQQGRFLGRAALVVAQDAESAAASTARGYGGKQPPASRTDEFRDLIALLGQAEAALTEVRVAIAAGREGDYAQLGARLRQVETELLAVAAPLRKRPS